MFQGFPTLPVVPSYRLVRRDAQDLHKKISANIARAEAATWAEVKAVQADVASLGARMKTIAGDQSYAIKADLKAAMVKLDAAAGPVEHKAHAGKDAIARANAISIGLRSGL